ncbi:unnamed protein product [Gongylonema pulchrum]|uniref:NOT2_3_5 domain-containing protein n=1 Tax=Gongylonema pulchrum TaxID=637853 RepID=A0A183CWN9_9BILA|nr:unnamed protein product [Gongylonema pulchrum]
MAANSTPGSLTSLDTSPIGFSGYRAAGSAIQSASGSGTVIAGSSTSQSSASATSSAFGASPYLASHFPNGYQPGPDFSRLQVVILHVLSITDRLKLAA